VTRAHRRVGIVAAASEIVDFPFVHRHFFQSFLAGGGPEMAKAATKKPAAKKAPAKKAPAKKPAAKKKK